MRLVVARCEVHYAGRLTAILPEAARRLLVFKADGSVPVHDDAGGYEPLNWMTPRTVLEEHDDCIVDQLSRYLERIELGQCRGALAAQSIKPEARMLAESHGIRCVEVDLAVLR